MFLDKMRKKHKSVILAQCDAHVTKAVLEETDRFVDTMVNKLSVEEYQDLLESSPLHLFYDQLLQKCYQEAKNANFSIRPDSFCGYGLFYGGADILETSKQKDCLEGLWALLEVIDKEDQQLIKPISLKLAENREL